MNLSSNATAGPSASHVDLDEIRVISHALFCGQVSIQEARVAMALLCSPDAQGLRQIEVASGLSADTLLKVLPQSGFSSDLLTCRTRGVFTWEPKDRRPMTFEHRSFVDHNPLISLEDLQKSRSEGLYWGDDDGGRNLTGVLDPSLDRWANKDGKLGDAGWALAMVTLLDSMTFTLGELERILGIGVRQVRRVIERMEHLATKSRVGRTVRVTVDMSVLVHQELKRSRAARKSAEHQAEASAVKAMTTQLGRTVREMWRNRLGEIRQLREYLGLIPELDKARHRIENMIRLLSSKGRWTGERQLRKYLDPLSV